MGKWLDLLAVFGLFLHVSGVVSATSEESTPNQRGCSEVSMSTELQIPFRACYVQEAKVAPLVAQVLAVVKTFNSREDYAQHTGVQLQKFKLEELEVCSNEKIRLLTEELVWITQRFWKLSNRLEEPVDAQVQLLKTRKIALLRHLRKMVVYTGDSAASAMQLASFKAQVDLLDVGFNQALTTFRTERPVRSNVTVDSIHAAIKTQLQLQKLRSNILDPGKTVAELIEISKTIPEKMSAALPQLVSNWYAGTLDNFSRTLQLVTSLPSVNHRVLGYSALHDEMRKASHLETYELTLLAAQLKELDSSLASVSVSSSGFADRLSLTVAEQYKQLVEKVRPIYKFIGHQNTTCKITNAKYLFRLNCCNLYLPLSSASGPNVFFTFSSSNQAAPALFEFSYSPAKFYSTDSESLSDSKRALQYASSPPVDAFKEWKLIPVQGGKYYKILNAKYDEVLYADRAEFYGTTLRKVLLARNTYAGPRVYEEEEALWSIQCNE